MHSKPMADSEGDFGKEEATPLACPKCGKVGQVFAQTWESHCGGFEDERYECLSCGKVWWVEGPDS